jgi:pimeloyl-ACP methyl ester carboxylesterase
MRLVLIPGMGVDERLFDPQRELPFPFTVPAWPKAKSTDTFETYAARFADQVGPCDAIGGISFGGMVAQAMAAAVGAKVVIGIATARNGKQIPGAVRFAKGLTGGSVSILGALPVRHGALALELIRTARVDVIREASRMIPAWKGASPPCPVRLIHGDRDVLIRAAVVKPDRVIRGGGHLINLTHPKAVNQFIVECLKGIR